MNDEIEAISEVEILFSNIDLHGKVVIDVGCGNGKITRMLSNRCKYIYGIDTPEIIEKTLTGKSLINVQFKSGIGQELPFHDNSADVIIFFASFHHVPDGEMVKAIRECYRVLKNSGQLCFLEPAPKENSYYELLRIADDEAEIQKQAYQIIKSLDSMGFNNLKEAGYYLVRSYGDFEDLVENYISEEEARSRILEEAKKLIKLKNLDIEKATWKSYCRINILEKKSNY
jgi:ubiquinone/menaquinone biosynthesis C-methylase UbiE